MKECFKLDFRYFFSYTIYAGQFKIVSEGKMKRRSIINFVTGLLAICGSPILLLLQSNQSDFKGPSAPERTDDEICFESVSEWAAWAREGHSGSLIRLAEYYRRYGKEQTAEAWLRYGAIQLHNPALTLYYGDYLRRRNRGKDCGLARIMYHQALSLAERNRQKDFADAVRQRLVGFEQEKMP